jgi:amidase
MSAIPTGSPEDTLEMSALTGLSSSELNIVEASISDLQDALCSGSISSVELVALYLRRISTYDCCGISLNSIPLLNERVFEEAAASDDRRTAGLPLRPLEGIPYTVKDSYKVKGLTVANGSPAFQNLIATEDAFVVQQLRDAGAVLLGQTNQPPMMYGGMQRGLYGRAESPYDLDYLTAAFASGSSNGSATSTSASFAAFGLGSETVSSGRSPASNNALIAYTPSRGLISPAGIWPLYPTCDVVVPHTRAMEDMFDILNVLTAQDPTKEGDLWRQQPHVLLPDPSTIFPESFHDLVSDSSLIGRCIAVPETYIGGSSTDGSKPVTTRQSVIDLWKIARADLETLGATIVPTSDFPIVTNYERETFPGQSVNVPGCPPNWNETERGAMIAHAWNDFLLGNGDPGFPSLSAVDTSQIWPTWDPESVQVRYSEPANAIRWSTLSAHLSSDPAQNDMLSLPGLPQALHALEAARKRDLEDWLDAQGLDFVVFPANGDVGRADADINDASSQHAWTNGVKYSNGNRAIRHLGVPTVSVPMGIMNDIGMPVNLIFAGKAYDDCNLLSFAYAYEQISRRRSPPRLTPSLDSDSIPLKAKAEARIAKYRPSRGSMDSFGRHRQPQCPPRPRPRLEIVRCESTALVEDPSELQVDISGAMSIAGRFPGSRTESDPLEYLIVYVNGAVASTSELEVTGLPGTENEWSWDWTCSKRTPLPVSHDERTKTDATVVRDQTMVVIVAKAKDGGASGFLRLL